MHAQLGVLDQARLDGVSASKDPKQARIGRRLVIGILDQHAHFATDTLHDIATAERFYRRVMKMDPADPAAPFSLGNVLRSSGRDLEAEAAYRTSMRADPDFASAWYNLADVLDDQRCIDEAIECLTCAWCLSHLC
jgi:tetratricopeptide (TPR) repeat protein